MVGFDEESFRCFDRNSPWLKCLVAFNVHIRNALLEVLHDPQRGGIPSDPVELFNFFQRQLKRINKLRKKRNQRNRRPILNSDQVASLLPRNKRTLSRDWNIPLICVVIINFSNLPPPKNGWFRPLDSGDFSVSAFVVVARSELLIRLKDGIPDDFNDVTNFGPFWSKIHDTLKILKYTRIDDFHDLESNMVDLDNFVVMNIGEIKDDAGDKIDKKQIISDVYHFWLQNHCKFVYVICLRTTSA